jgi:DNA-binding NarL/FixJ family response regulator
VLDAGASLFVSKCNTSDFICARLQWLMERDGRAPAPPAETAADYRLTLRQQQVLRLMGEGWPNKIVADRLQITEQTVKLHVKQIFKELRVYNRTQAVLKAQKLQIL